MELIFADIDQKRLNFHVGMVAPDNVDILIWLASDAENVMPCLLIKLEDMQLSGTKTVQYIINSTRMNDGMVALQAIPRWGFINCHHGFDHELPSNQEPIVDRPCRHELNRFHGSFRSLRDRVQGVTDSELSGDEEGGGGVCGE